MMTIRERLDKIRIIEGQRELAELARNCYAIPLLSDIGAINALYARFREVCDPACKDNTKIFVLLAFYIYDPVSLVTKRMVRGKVRKEIGKVLGISASAVTRHFADAKGRFSHVKTFRDEAERVYIALQGD